ncbi:hypothetical protein DYB26_014324 [Aphanomyces astaci]|uniref:Cation efflux protein transmembrane domain-containing protein n=1 Tax=Aphanomyces astaci TaxID=112090 RepID=A0A397EE44_APHAT|nr:hypothetical protein DYB36_000803 [Aphanomyces astaci]RHY81797.1 hypothetical protein DYB31_011875 [Aphanomyces astaci]RHZ31539.1 hypothetical protein DYB26_014324 [Aphanomyces astaci]
MDVASTQKDRVRDDAQRKLEWACLFCMLFMFVEFLGGYFAGSLAIMSDAAHLLSDVLSFFLSLFALYLSKLPPSVGREREIPPIISPRVLGALASIVVIWILTLGLVWAAIQRILALLSTSPDAIVVPPVNGKAMFIVACMGLLVNIALMKILGHGHSHGGHGHSHGGHGHAHGAPSKQSPDHHSQDHHHGLSHGHAHDHHSCDHVHQDHADESHDDCGRSSCVTACSSHDDHDLEEPEAESSAAPGDGCAAENLNVRAAYLHALGDFLQSLGVCIAGALIWYEPSWQLCDPVVTLFFSVIVGATTVGICKTTLHVLMEGTPDVHDLRVWSISSSSFAVAMHVVEARGLEAGDASSSLIVDVQACVMAHHDFEFVTVQVEQDRDANLCPFNLRQVIQVVV